MDQFTFVFSVVASVYIMAVIEQKRTSLMIRKYIQTEQEFLNAVEAKLRSQNED